MIKLLSSDLYDPKTGAALLTTAQVARFLHYHTVSILRLVGRGDLRPHARAGKSLLFLREEVERFLHASRWAANKGGIIMLPNPPLKPYEVKKLEAVVTTFGEKKAHVLERINSFDWSDLPKIRARMDQRHGKIPFRVSVQAPDGSGWQIDFHASALALDHYDELPGRRRRHKTRDTWLIN